MSKFDQHTIKAFTRRYAASMSLPKVRRVEFEELQFTKDLKNVKVVDVFNIAYIPPHSDLLIWRSRLRNMGKDHNAYIASDHGNFVLENVEYAIKLHDAKSISDCVFQETSWFQNPPKRPHSVSQYPSQDLLERFQDVISNTPSSNFIENLFMKPCELAGF